jgi:hypothetical protein
MSANRLKTAHDATDALVCVASRTLPRVAPYAWPVKPFDKQHPVRGFLNDPRIQGQSRAFHFGIDVSAPDGTAVYAVEPGKVHIESPFNVEVESPGREFGYWHIVPAVEHHQQVAKRQLLGHIAAGWGHVHFAERRGGVYQNPLRAGAIEPYADHTSPTIVAIELFAGRKSVPRAGVSGVVDVVAEAFDTTPIPVPPPWDRKPVSPLRLRWRLLRGAKAALPWVTGVDFRVHIRNDLFGTVYAPGTKQNHPNEPGRLRYYVARGWDTRRLADGSYRLQVEAEDTEGNKGRAAIGIELANEL